MTNDCKTCPVSTGTHKPAEAVHQIDEPQAEALLELAAYRFTVENREARIAELESQLEAIGAGGVEPLRKPAAAPQAVQAAGRVYLVATGEVRNGMELYERHDEPVPLAECEVLYASAVHAAHTAPQAAVPQGVERWPSVEVLAASYEDAFGSKPTGNLYVNLSVLALALQERCNLAATQPAVQGIDGREFPPLTPELASILGLMCFQCISFAQALRAAGHTIKTRAEDEQAAVLHWMLGHYFRHGDDWRTAAAEDMKRMEAEALAAQPKQGGDHG
ncbi:hypothetical protein [Comamonas aquatica]|nr:hypothetical protein [Comamonas aquatica]